MLLVFLTLLLTRGVEGALEPGSTVGSTVEPDGMTPYGRGWYDDIWETVHAVTLPEFPSDIELAQAEANQRLRQVSRRFRETVDDMRSASGDRLDMVFLIDASASVGRQNFAAELRFMRKLLADFDVSLYGTRVALVTFSSRRHVVRHVDQISVPSAAQDKCTLLQDQLPAIRYRGGGTFTYGAMTEAEAIFRGPTEPKRTQVIFLITDGYSNGRSPLPVAKRLKKAGVRIFAIGIETGNDEELAAMVTSSAHLYLVSSFEQFEQLARQALHHDYRFGAAAPVANGTVCNRLCDVRNLNATGGCCDELAECGCSTNSGHYRCSCKPGYTGSGLRGECYPCANGTFWNQAGVCETCPHEHQITQRLGALSVRECVCRHGYQQNEDGRCQAVTCVELQPPPNGFFVMNPKPCGRVLNAACGVRCRPGYELSGTSIRLCQANGTWSGTEVKCTLKECPRLSIPYYGMAVCTNADLNLHYDYTPHNKTFMANYGGPTSDRYTEAMPIDTECSFKCGPGFYLKGSHTRSCMTISKWDGLQTQCKQILCPPLPSFPYATYEPTDCAVSKSAFGTNCTLICDFGFEMEGGGPWTRQCGGKRTGVWSGRSKAPRCVDVAPPFLECPGHYSVLMDDTFPYALLRRLQQPYVYDNSGDNYTYWVRPAIPEAGLHLALGDHRFTYIAADAFKNRARCSFSVSVIDQTPPEFGACRDPPVHYVSQAHNPQETFVHWDDPHVMDNSGMDGLTLTKNVTQGYLPAGVHHVRYRASDRTGNVAECIMRLEVRQYSCDEVPDLGPNGVAVCAQNGTHVWCELSCKDDYEFHNLTDDTVTLVCDRTRPTWGVRPESVPECSPVVSPAGVQKVLTVRLTQPLPEAACGEALDTLSALFNETLHDQMCGEQPECALLTSVPECGGDGGGVGDVADNATRYHLVRRRRARPGEPRSAVKVVVYQRVSQKLGLWRPEGKKSENIKRIKEELRKINYNEQLRRRLGALKLDLRVLKLDELIDCTAGSVARNLLCVQCPRGTYHNRTSGCMPCPTGTFNERPGQVECQVCPPFHNTARPHAKHAHDCKAQCGPGTVARLREVKVRRLASDADGETTVVEPARFQKTLMPFCRKCDAGQYQEHHNRLECRPCPAGHTSRRGARNPADCFPLQTVAPPRGDGGEEPELAALNPCGSGPCLNGGTCVAREGGAGGEGFECRCGGAWVGGRYCEVYVDPCTEGLCGGGGTCVEVEGRAVCDCGPGYEGERCERRRQDYCSPNPCQSAGICEGLGDGGAEGYRCRCPAGKVGRRCHLEPCDYEPCGGRSRCLNGGGGGGGFRCVCPGGWRGAPNCTEVDDPCEGPRYQGGWCQHGGSCVPVKRRQEGEEGVGDPEDDEAGYGEVRCECPPDRGGERCERPVSTDFSLEFPGVGGGGGDSFVRLPLPAGSWEAVGVCGWFATGDTFNYGTLVSYATPPATDNALTLTDQSGLVVYVNGRHVVTGVALDDGEWHGVCVGWASAGGRWAVYLDGVPRASGAGLAEGTEIAGGGQLVLGQDQDAAGGGGFSETEAYRGRMAYVAVWARELSGAEVARWYHRGVCGGGGLDGHRDLLLRWSDVQQRGVVGRAVRTAPSGFCGRCAPNLTLAHGSVTYAEGERGQRAVFRCDRGYTMSGDEGNEAHCLPTSRWTLGRPTCKLVRCGTLASPLNGRAILSTGSGGGGAATYGAVVRFTCDAGFLLVGDAEMRCRVSGTWTGGPDPPVCRSVDRCPALQPDDPLRLAKIIYADDRGVLPKPQPSYDVGVLAEIRCADGWAPEGDDLMTCRDGGYWDMAAEPGTRPRCVPRQVPSPPAPPTTPRVIRVSRRPDLPFWNTLRDFLLHGCHPTPIAGRSVLCLEPGLTSTTWRDLTDYQLLPTATAEPLVEQLLRRLLATAADGGPDPTLQPAQLLPYILFGFRNGTAYQHQSRSNGSQS
ncbi:sushi, von Willebrand factor type A, EGF and pentraxin domain-containing protein 1-like [Anopheles bellator]|uniref:sushi, von Willebrand factor type A, EGF and pentraxin domain-containing protein 1-like n=1 Tax=Anopheles bellator TaxID=139047 RepID=UPI002648D2F3|nr:sushi, von Willebrand factor type A, EGF and pentraxin domain-containing protein 1-like [Anopheles bellator]